MMRRIALPLAVLAVLVVFASALTVDQTCYNVGALSGCSGCEKGTNGLCRFLGHRLFVGLGYTNIYGCYPASIAPTLINSNVGFFYGGSLCSSVTSESTIGSATATGGGAGKKRSLEEIQGATIGAKKASTIFSKTVKNGKVKFSNSNGKQSIDRTSSTQPLGGLAGSIAKKRAVPGPTFEDLNCENFNSEELLTEVSTFDGCNLGFATDGGLGEAQRDCVKKVNAAWAAVLCPEYNTSVSGFCQTLVDTVELSCTNAGCDPYWPWQYFSGDIELVLEDDAAYCISSIGEVGVEGMSGYFEAVNNFFEVAAAGPRSGLEVAIVHVKNWAFDMDMNYTDAINILLNESLQLSKSVRIHPYFDFELFEDFGKKRESYWEFQGSDGVIVQVTGQVYIPNNGSHEFIIESSEKAYLSVGDQAAWSEDGIDLYLTVDLTAGWKSFTAILFTDGNFIESAEMYVDSESYPVGDVAHDEYAVQTYSTAAEYVPPAFTPCFTCEIIYFPPLGK